MVKKKFMVLTSKLRGAVTNICELPNHLLILVFEFLDKRERLFYQRLCKQMKQVAESPYLWQDLILRN